MRSSRKILLILSLLFPALIAFQNCSLNSGYDSKNSQSSKPTGDGNNGEGYTGKVYVNYDVASTCASGDVKNQIEEKDGAYVQTVKDCVAVSPVDVSKEVDTAAYNDSAVFSASALYEKLGPTQKVYSEVVCRGEGPNPKNDRKGMADVSMQPTGQFQTDPSGKTFKVYKGYVKVGEYDLSGNLLNKKEFEIAKAVERTASDGIRFFAIESQTSANAANPNGGPPTPGTVDDEQYGLMLKANNTGAFVFKTPEMSEAILVPGLNCYFH